METNVLLRVGGWVGGWADVCLQTTVGGWVGGWVGGRSYLYVFDVGGFVRELIEDVCFNAAEDKGGKDPLEAVDCFLLLLLLSLAYLRGWVGGWVDRR